MVASSALRPAIFPTKACICKMTLTSETQSMRRKTAANSVEAGQRLTEKGYSKILCTSPVTESSVIGDLLFAHEHQLQSCVEKIKKKMGNKSWNNDGVKELIMIDAIQRLGLEYYFRDDIHVVLERHYEHFVRKIEVGSNLHDDALRFRLLRQAGYNVSADIFNEFKEKDINFSQELRGDTRGLMSLFEASQLSIPGDHILDEAGEFCAQLLKTTMANVGVQSEARLIEKSLSNPYHKSLPRLTTKNEVHDIEISLEILHDCYGMNDWVKEVKNLAKIDVRNAQITHKNEITQVSRWWKELGLTNKLKHARNQPEKWHMWSLVVLPGPNMAELRTELTKSISFIYIIDDIFDVYGTLEELTLFTEAVNRWDYTDIKGLPNYMIMCLKALYDTTNEISERIYLTHGWNPKDYLKKAWAELCDAFLVEARWFASGLLPTTEEYLKNGIVSSGVYVVCANVFSLLGEAVNNRSSYLLSSHSDIVSSASKILRLWDDLGTSKDENQDGHDGSFIACYMNQHEDSSADDGRKYVLQMISDAWKCLNQECLSPTPFSADFRTALLNLARMVPVMYSYDVNHSLPSLEKYMISMLHE